MKQNMTGVEMVEHHDKLKSMAFPLAVTVDGVPAFVTGLSKAEYFAGQILQGLMSTGQFADVDSEEGQMIANDVAIELAATWGSALALRMENGRRMPIEAYDPKPKETKNE